MDKNKRILIITLIITILPCISYFAYLQSYNPKWINDYIKIFYLSVVLGIYFLVFSILYIIKCTFKLQFKKIQKHFDIALIPLVISFAVMFSYAICLTIFNFSSIFHSILNFWQYFFIILAILVAPSIMFGQTLWITNFMQKMIRTAVIEDVY